MSEDDATIQRALSILEKRIVGGWGMAHQHGIIRHAALRLIDERREVVLAYWLDADQRLISVEEMAIGSSESVCMDSRYVMRRAVTNDAVYAAFAHNHHGGYLAASDADRTCAEKLNSLMAMIGVLVLGHYAIGESGAEEVVTGERWFFPLEEDDCRARCPNCNALLEENHE